MGPGRLARVELLTPPFCLVPGTEVEGPTPLGKEPQESWLPVRQAEPAASVGCPCPPACDVREEVL